MSVNVDEFFSLLGDELLGRRKGASLLILDLEVLNISSIAVFKIVIGVVPHNKSESLAQVAILQWQSSMLRHIIH